MTPMRASATQWIVLQTWALNPPSHWGPSRQGQNISVKTKTISVAGSRQGQQGKQKTEAKTNKQIQTQILKLTTQSAKRFLAKGTNTLENSSRVGLLAGEAAEPEALPLILPSKGMMTVNSARKTRIHVWSSCVKMRRRDTLHAARFKFDRNMEG